MHNCSDKVYHCKPIVQKQQIIVIQQTSAFSNGDKSKPPNTGHKTPLEVARERGHTEMVRLLKAAATGLTNIALSSKEIWVFSIKLILRGIFCSCREVQRQTKVCESPAGGCTHIRFAVICVKIYFIYSMQPLCTLILCIMLYALCYVTRSGKFEEC